VSELGVLTPRGAADLAGAVARVGGHVVAERWRRRTPIARDAVPGAATDLTTDWLTAHLCAAAPGAEVLGFELGGGSSGTSVRATVTLTYNEAGREAGLPASVFAKLTPGLSHRVALGITAASTAEAGFYNELRRELTIEAPVGYWCGVDQRSQRSLQLIEDLVATKAATFCTPEWTASRAQVEQVVDTLASLHAAFDGRVAAHPWLRTYPAWWRVCGGIASVKRFHRRGFNAASEVLPDGLRRRGHAAAWDSFVASVAVHHALEPTLLHSDVHLGNWYVTADGDMGLCDWQAISAGHWSRDLAYALATTMTVEDRRAWDRALVERYVERRASPGIAADDAWLGYRRQLPGAMLMWTPTLSPPPGFPDMQPRATALEMLRRITTAMDDLGTYDALEHG
jgi:hypothetical protein